ncbi:prevent-host-death protein antitoxin of TAS system [Arthrobacter sp. UC242_113]|uniref:prevent-host-death protein antitoxin of TAS system n=1 Tax=Arthrobacter sp. UC242_113 TaxID=3374550 RepID=UPI0037566C29
MMPSGSARGSRSREPVSFALERCTKILERVKNGETIGVTSNGGVAATLIPPAASPLEHLLLTRSVRRASANPVDFQILARVQSGAITAEILSDLRGDR